VEKKITPKKAEKKLKKKITPKKNAKKVEKMADLKSQTSQLPSQILISNV